MVEDPASETIVNPPSRWKRVFAAIGIVMLAIWAYVWFGMSPKVPLHPVRMTRAADGTLRPVDGQGQGGATLELQAGAIRSSNSFCSCSTSSRPGNARFADRRLMILNRSGHLLMACVGKDLLDRLKAVNFLEQVDYLPYGFKPEPGGLAPDVCVTLNLTELKSTGIVQEDVEARIAVSMSNGAPGCRNSYTDNLTAPVITFDWSGQLEHKSTTTGVASSAARYKLVAADVGKQIFDAVSKELKERRQKEGALSDFPGDFWPPYRRPPELPLDGLGSADVQFTWHGFMNHDETLWQLHSNRAAVEAFGELQRRMQKLGWTGEMHTNDADTQHPFLRMTKEAAVLTAYIQEQMGTPAASDSRTTEPPLMLHYIDRMSENEVRTAVDHAMAAGVALDSLIAFENLCSEKQCAEIIQRFGAHPARTPQGSLALANLYHRRHQDDKARDELRRTLALTNTVYEHGDLDGGIRELAKNLKDEKLPDRPIELKVYLQLGFLELTPNAKIPPQDVLAGEPLHFFFKAKDGKIRTVSLCVLKDSATSFQVQVVRSMEHGRSTSSGGTRAALWLENGSTVSFTVGQPDAQSRYRVTTTVLPTAGGNGN